MFTLHCLKDKDTREMVQVKTYLWNVNVVVKTVCCFTIIVEDSTPTMLKRKPPECAIKDNNYVRNDQRVTHAMENMPYACQL